MNQIEEIINEVIKQVKQQTDSFEVEASGRHVHLSRSAIDQLFGEGYQLTKAKDLSQPGQFACKERVTIAGPKGIFQNVIILGPERPESQVEVSMTDVRVLGINAPVRESGDIAGTPGVIIMNGEKSLALEKGLIIAKRHIHMTPEDAEKLGVTNQEIVKVEIQSQRPLIFDDVVVRVSPKFATYMHIDYDEANACGFQKGDLGRIVK
ncbi:putative phosphotransacetylase [Enterococcus sp. PF1-24]|uniref:ethanolamine utilization phosphate acetyltransferase EutD n=1 Tax=unclassified Enterococcus TaxID=2608891 RepID=UPI0024753923|nr:MULTISPECIES: ethanolamine utilization phosphate acetyltransferase EutD [unclassified Enterococcus]MDH6363322.1 putative phosphotransacetylase [Enterococcus sp. PFB1-1]MDH6400377.1 putative phosphotransacetylase [Enterococcus sp. PF1-24]